MPQHPSNRPGKRRPHSFSKSERLLKRVDFVKLNRSGNRRPGKHFTVIFKHNKMDATRLGVTVSKRIGNAVQRNRVKRLVREFFRLNKSLFPQGYDFVIAAKKGAGKLDSRSANEELGGIIADKTFRTQG